ncbi:hypothetical protein AAMO2058_000725700 [Amorphochlora amoebiformis]
MTNMIIGAGVLALPYAFRAAGVLPAICICISVWIASSYSFVLLARCAEELQEFSYKDVATRTYGPDAAQFSEAAILIYTIGNLIGRQIILGDLLPPLVQVLMGIDSIFAQRWVVLSVVTGVILIPVSLSPYIDSLKWSSVFGLVCMCYVVLLFVGLFSRGFQLGMVNPMEARAAHSSFLSLMAFPLLVVSFTAHYNTMDMYWELKSRSIDKMRFVVSISTGICLAVYLLVGLTGYFLFMDKTEPNILVNLWVDREHPPHILISTAFAAISLAVSFSFPLVCHGARNSIKKLFFFHRGGEIYDDGRDTEHTEHVCITLAVVMTSLIIGLYIPDIGVIFAFMGSTVGVTFVYILPGLFYLKIVDSRRSRYVDDSFFGEKFGPTALIAFGGGIGVMGTIATSLHTAGFI